MSTSIAASQANDQPDEYAGYSWAASNDSCSSMTRTLTYLERMFVILNRDLYGQNCPFIGATIRLERGEYSPRTTPLNSGNLQARAIEAFCQTRWRYPTVAARLVNGTEAVYTVDSEAQIMAWARRTVTMCSQEGGWFALRERLSRDTSIPSVDGDYCLIYLIVRPDEISKPDVSTFDILMHTHHVFTDGSGFRSILNEFLTRLAQPLTSEDISWGQEIERLLPASPLLEKDEQVEAAKEVDKMPVRGERLKGWSKPDVGLPVHRPDLSVPNAEYRGSLLVTHTFEDADFLHNLLNIGRGHGVKLTAVLHAALLKAIYDDAVLTPTSDDVYKSGSAQDLRLGHMVAPYGERNEYVNSAVAIQPIEVPCDLFKIRHEVDDFWRAASFIGGQWDIMKEKKQIARMMEADAKIFVNSWENKSVTGNGGPSPKPRTCPYFISDLPGSHQFDGIYPILAETDMRLILDSYQLATDQIQAVVSARSHSWNDKLTLCLVFNAIRNPRAKMEEFLEKWVQIVADLCEADSQ